MIEKFLSISQYGRILTLIPPPSADLDQMKERFSKLLLGEDMSGGGKGVSTALAISNALTNLSAAVFGELHKLEPLAPERKRKWKRELEWLLCPADHIVEMVPSMNKNANGPSHEVRAFLYMMLRVFGCILGSLREWLLCLADHILEMVPSMNKNANGPSHEVRVFWCHMIAGLRMFLGSSFGVAALSCGMLCRDGAVHEQDCKRAQS